MNLIQKILVGAGIVGSSLLPIKSFGQSSLENKQPAQTTQETKKWDTWFGIGTIMPHDETLKDAFGSYWALSAEGRARIAKDMYLAPSITYMWDKLKESGDEASVSGIEVSGLLAYQMENFSIGAGPTISTLNVSANGGSIGSRYSVSENYSKLGFTLDMRYVIPIKNNLGVVLFGRYTHMEKDKDEWPETLGTTRVGAGFQF